MQTFFATIPSWVFWVVGIVWGGSLLIIVVCMWNAEFISPLPEERKRS